MIDFSKFAASGGLGVLTSTIGAIGSGIGGFFSAQADKSKLKLQQSYLDAQAYTADTNAKIAELGAKSALLQGQQRTAALTLQAGQLKSKQRVALAANGVDLGEGSAAEQLASTEVMKEIDKSVIEANTIQTAWGYRMQATNFSNQAIGSRAGATATGRLAGSISPFSTGLSAMLNSATTVAPQWYKFSRTTAPTTVHQTKLTPLQA